MRLLAWCRIAKRSNAQQMSSSINKHSENWTDTVFNRSTARKTAKINRTKNVVETKEREWTSWWRGSRPCWLMYTSSRLNRRALRAQRRKSYRIFWWNCGIKSMRAGIHARRGIRLVWLGVWWAGRKLRRYWRIRWVSPCHPAEPDYKFWLI